MRNLMATMSLVSLNMIGAAAQNGQDPFPQWAKLAFKTASDNSPLPPSSFIVGLDPGVFTNVSNIQQTILEQCRSLASIPVNDWDDDSIAYFIFNQIPNSLFYKQQAAIYTTTFNEIFGDVNHVATNCAANVITPFSHTTPFVDWSTGPWILFTVGVVFTLCLLTYITYAVSQRTCKTTSTGDERDRLFSLTGVETDYGTLDPTDSAELETRSTLNIQS